MIRTLSRSSNSVIVPDKCVPIQQFKPETLRAISNMLMRRTDDGMYKEPTKHEIVAYLNQLIEEKSIQHYVLPGKYNNVYLFDEDEVYLKCRWGKLITVERFPKVIPIQCHGDMRPKAEHLLRDTPLPFELSRITELYKLPFAEYNTGTCVYFLCKHDKVVYVGQAVDAYKRVQTHLKDGKEFDSVYYIRVAGNMMGDIETALIKYLQPEYNKSNLKMRDGVISIAESILNIS